MIVTHKMRRQPKLIDGSKFKCAGCHKTGIYFWVPTANLCKTCGRILQNIEKHNENIELFWSCLLLPNGHWSLPFKEEPGMREQIAAILKDWGMNSRPGDDL